MAIFFLIFFLSLMHFFNDAGKTDFGEENCIQVPRVECTWLSARYIWHQTMNAIFARQHNKRFRVTFKSPAG